MKKILLTQAYPEDENELVFSLDDKNDLNQLKWEGDDEFSLNGEMYDVIERKIENGKMFLRCISDKKETALLKKLSDNWRENEKSNNIVNELLQLLQGLFHDSGSEEFVLNEPIRYNDRFPSEGLPFQIKKIPTPPPQF